jgi:hypothetical protein
MQAEFKAAPLMGLAALAALGLGSTRPALAQTTVYSQPATFPNTISAWTSDNNTGSGAGYQYTTFDDFSLTSAASLGGLTWQGLTFDASGVFKGGTSVPSSFTIEFLTDNAGNPGAILSQQSVSAVGTAVGTVDLVGSGNLETVYNYSAALPTAFPVPANTREWVSVIGNIAYPSGWSWTQGTGGNGISYQLDGADTGSGPRTGDRAFTLTTAPEPSQNAAFGLGILGLAGLAFKVRQHKCLTD